MPCVEPKDVRVAASLDRKHYFVVYRRYLRRNALMQRQTIIKYLRLPGDAGWRTAWIMNPTKASHFEKQEDAYRMADKYHANVTRMSEEA